MITSYRVVALHYYIPFLTCVNCNWVHRIVLWQKMWVNSEGHTYFVVVNIFF